MKFSVIILAAGTSGRMGKDKASLAFDDLLNFVSHLLENYLKAGPDSVLLVMNELNQQSFEQFLNVETIINRYPEKGRSRSLKLGLDMVIQGNACFIHNVDNPFISMELIDGMLHQVNPANHIVPVYDGKSGHPLLLGPDIVEYLQTVGDPGDIKVLLKQFAKISLNWPDERVLLNINTPADYVKFQLLQNEAGINDK